MKASTLLGAVAICLPFSTPAQHSHGAQTPCAGMQSRAINSLSDQDFKELRRGGVWGLALAAELNGMPGPAHLLELKDQIPLTQDQVDKTQALFVDMRKAAGSTGERLIAAETALEAAFAKGPWTRHHCAVCWRKPSPRGRSFATSTFRSTSRRCGF
ncbi:hypothetical protein [Hydrogenophaga sp.]|uniref:hypothetical protein n=1 Tax=Hydrogenophaga sp. TaxID=1904254 RepID=UPI002620681F|nr:hypothetical protein [Hydrogenophaga sp.]MDM7948385.1 hypothetical protein [Hydrogenophaga sp.]